VRRCGAAHDRLLRERLEDQLDPVGRRHRELIIDLLIGLGADLQRRARTPLTGASSGR